MTNAKKPPIKSLFLRKMSTGSTKPETRNQDFAIRNFIEKKGSCEQATATISQRYCTTITSVSGDRQNHSGNRRGLAAISRRNSSRKHHIIGSSGSDVERDLLSRNICCDRGTENRKIHHAARQFSNSSPANSSTKGNTST